MLKVFVCNNPGWGVPCVSPFVTKTLYYLKMADISFVTERQNLQTLHADAPYAKLPYIIDSDGTKVADSTEIIRYLKQTRGDKLDSTATVSEQSVMHAWNCLIDEHLYWAAVIEPRYGNDGNFDLYRSCLVGMDPVPAEVNVVLDQFRALIKQALVGHGLGRMSAKAVYERGMQDVDAIVGFLGNRKFFVGNEPRSIDAVLVSMLKHVMYVPFEFPIKDYALSQRTLVDYCQRMDDQFGLKQLAGGR